MDEKNRILPVDFGDVCINYDKKYFADNKLPVPVSLQDLLKPEYGKESNGKGLLVVENPAKSSPGLAFLFATVAVYGEEGYLQFWKALKDNGVEVANDWNTAYYTNFSGSSGKGLQPMVVSYASSPAAEVLFASTTLTEAPTASIITPDTCYRQVEFVGILKGTRNLALAQKFVDFMLDIDFQEDIPLQMFVYPVNSQAELPEAFTLYAQTAQEPVMLDMAVIGENREKWIQAWTEVMLR
jgi:thiamine transport system substrate-binding protein